jgi:hypothetical protein
MPIFSLAAAGSLVCLSADFALKFCARKMQRETIAMGLWRGEPAATAPAVDPVVTFGFIVSSYGAIALALVTALPGALALARTILAFAFLCVGGLISEISSACAEPVREAAAEEEEEAPVQRKPSSVLLSAALTLVLNLAFAVLSSGQGLIDIVPPQQAVGGHAQELAPVVVVAHRTHDPLYRRSESF